VFSHVHILATATRPHAQWYVQFGALHLMPHAMRCSLRQQCRLNYWGIRKTERLQLVYYAYSEHFWSSCTSPCRWGSCDICHLPPESWQFQDPSQQFPFHLSTGLRALFYHLHCTVFIRSYPLFAARLSRYTHLPIHSWHDIARNRVRTIIGRRNYINMTESVTDLFVKFAELKLTTVDRCSAARASLVLHVPCSSVSSALQLLQQAFPTKFCTNFW